MITIQSTMMNTTLAIYISFAVVVWLVLLGVLNPIGRVEWIFVFALTLSWPIWILPFLWYRKYLRNKVKS